MKEICGPYYEYQEKKNGKYVTTFTNPNEAATHEDLAQELIAKKLCACTWIKSIKREQLYNGYVKIVVTYDHNGRRVYYVRNH